MKSTSSMSAVPSLRDEIEDFPKDGDLSDLGDYFSELGNILADMGDLIGAEKAYREGTRRAPGCASCYGALAVTLQDRNDLAGAERVLRRGIANFTEGGIFSDVNILYNDLGAYSMTRVISAGRRW